jgi:hypothetical protein
MEYSPRINNLLSKLRNPLHFDFICENILNSNKVECLDILTELIEDGVIEENKRYYKIKSNDNKS